MNFANFHTHREDRWQLEWWRVHRGNIVKEFELVIELKSKGHTREPTFERLSTAASRSESGIRGSDDERSQEIEELGVVHGVFGAVAALGNRKIFILGDWNFEPGEFPIHLLHGGQVNQPLSDVDCTSPKGKTTLDWILCSKAMLPACDLETVADKKPDHVAIKMDFQLELVSQAYLGQKSYETAEKTDPLDIAVA
eukprot:5004947-Amphidinium_carterae.2